MNTRNTPAIVRVSPVILLGAACLCGPAACEGKGITDDLFHSDDGVPEGVGATQGSSAAGANSSAGEIDGKEQRVPTTTTSAAATSSQFGATSATSSTDSGGASGQASSGSGSSGGASGASGEGGQAGARNEGSDTMGGGDAAALAGEVSTDTGPSGSSSTDSGGASGQASGALAGEVSTDTGPSGSSSTDSGGASGQAVGAIAGGVTTDSGESFGSATNGGASGDGGQAGAQHEGGAAGAAGETSGEGAPGEVTRCPATATFPGSPREVFDVRGVVGVNLSPDERTAYVATYHPIRNWQLASSVRTAPDERFAAPVEMDGVNSVVLDFTPVMSPDRLTLYLESTRSGIDKLYVTSREHPDDPFPRPVLIPGLSDLGNKDVLGGPYLSESGKLYFQMITSVGQDLYQSTPGPVEWGAPQRVADLGAALAFPVVTHDELTVYFAMQVSGLDWDIWRATRTSTTEAFDAAEPVVELNTEEAEFPSWLSPDDCRLYFDRSPGQDWRVNAVLMVEREPVFADDE